MNEVPVGIDWPDQSERFARLREAITLIKQLWAEEFVNFDGEYFKTHDATVYDRPNIPVPIYVAASGPAAARLAGRIGDGFICTSGKGEELYTETLLPSLAEGAEKAGRDVVGHGPDDRDEGQLRHRLRRGRWRTPRSGPRSRCRATRRWASTTRARWRSSPRRPSRTRTSAGWSPSDPDEHVEQIAPYVGWGFNHLVFHFPGDDQEEAIGRYGETILPQAARALRLTRGRRSVVSRLARRAPRPSARRRRPTGRRRGRPTGARRRSCCRSGRERGS